jgi:hypothetical protein
MVFGASACMTDVRPVLTSIKAWRVPERGEQAAIKVPAGQ